MEWVAQELGMIDLGDKRLNDRAQVILKKLSSSPERSIPSAHNGWHETKAAYRFMSNARVSFEKLLGEHRNSTLKRMEGYETIILAQDTSELDYSGQMNKAGRGPANFKSHYGMYLHPLVALTENGLCLGVLDAQLWHREEIGNREDHLRKSIEEKESYRWLEELREINELGTVYPKKHLIMVADREADIIEILSEKLNTNVDYIIRGRHDRCLMDSEKKLFEIVREQPCAAHIEFEFKERGGSSYRKVKQEVRFKRLQIKPSPNRGDRINLKPVEITAILATEKRPKKGYECLEWLLLTSIDIQQVEETLKVIQYYLLRWKIEIYFKVLKSGCKIEELQLNGLERISNCLAFYMIVAWRVMYLIQLGRDCPEMNCEVFFAEEEWRTAYMIHYRKKPPQKAPKLNEMIRVVAGIGGFLGRKSDGEPGPKHLWIGIQRIRDFVYALNIQNEVLGIQSYG